MGIIVFLFSGCDRKRTDGPFSSSITTTINVQPFLKLPSCPLVSFLLSFLSLPYDNSSILFRLAHGKCTTNVLGGIPRLLWYITYYKFGTE